MKIKLFYQNNKKTLANGKMLCYYCFVNETSM